MSRLVLLVLAVLAVSYVCGQKAKHCQVDAECRFEGKATTCSQGLCLQKCAYNSECASGDCEHEGLRWNGFCEVERGGECIFDWTCDSGKDCEHGYCVPDD